MKEFSKFEIATIKRTAQNVSSMVIKKNKIKAQIDELQEAYDKLVTMQDQYEAPIKTLTGGYTTEDLVDRVVEATGKTDKDGKPIKMTKYVLKYPETIIPVLNGEGATISDDVTQEEPMDRCPSDTAAPAMESVEHGTDPNDLPFMN